MGTHQAMALSQAAIPELSQPSRHGLIALCLGVACAMAAPPATMAAPLEGGLVAQATQTGAAAASTAQKAVGKGTRGPISSVQQTVVTEPVRAVVQTVRTPVERLADAAPRHPALPSDVRRTVDGAMAATNPEPGVRATGPKRQPRARGSIDRNASLQRGELAEATPFTSLPVSQELARDRSPAATAGPKGKASSTSARSGDSGRDDGPLSGPTTTGGLGAAVGLTLLLLAALVAVMLLAPRIVSRVLHMSPARRGPAVFFTPIQRPD